MRNRLKKVVTANATPITTTCCSPTAARVREPRADPLLDRMARERRAEERERRHQEQGLPRPDRAQRVRHPHHRARVVGPDAPREADREHDEERRHRARGYLAWRDGSARCTVSPHGGARGGRPGLRRLVRRARAADRDAEWSQPRRLRRRRGGLGAAGGRGGPRPSAPRRDRDRELDADHDTGSDHRRVHHRRLSSRSSPPPAFSAAARPPCRPSPRRLPGPP